MAVVKLYNLIIKQIVKKKTACAAFFYLAIKQIELQLKVQLDAFSMLLVNGHPVC